MNTNDNTKLIEFFKDKSVKSFLLSIEIFNKPTIDYRLEGSVFFLCNAWELLLKAKLLSDGKDIHYPEKNGISRSISLSEAAARVMTNEKDPVRVNLKVIISLRNLATHSIIPEFEIIYIPFLSFCVKSYASKLYDYFGIKINDYIKTDFLALYTNNQTFNSQEILSKYGNGISTLFSQKIDELNNVIEDNEDVSIAQKIEINLVRINNKSKADFTFYASNNPKEQNVKYIDRQVDYNTTHPLSHHQIVNEIDTIIKRNSIPFTPIRQPVPTKDNTDPNIFTTACFDVLSKKYKFKDNNDYCVTIEIGNTSHKKYSEKLITQIITMITEDPDVVIKAKK